MALLLYYIVYGQPSRAVLLALKALDLNCTLKEINLRNREQFSQEFLKINSQHTVPTLVDEDFILSDSHAIMCYLVEKYGKSDVLYPKDHRKRAVVNQRLHFDTSFLYPLIKSILRPLLYEGETQIPELKKEMLQEGYYFLEKFLDGETWVAGDTMTIADFSIVTTITSMDILEPVDEKEFPNIRNWMDRMKKLEYYSVSQEGVDKMKALVENALSRRN